MSRSAAGGPAVGRISKDEARVLTLPEEEIFRLSDSARASRSGRNLDLCSIMNAKSGACSEDCSFCAQSARSRTGAPVYPLVSGDELREACLSARENGARRFCVVTSGRRVPKAEMKAIARLVSVVAECGLHPCATLGLLDRDDLELLRDAGLRRYHCNLETSERFFPEMCRTHTYAEKMATIEAAKSAGLSVCSGGIFGLGETWEDRIGMAAALREIDVDSVPVNFLVPVAGTPLAGRSVMRPEEALRIIALYRLMLPDKEIRVCGGRSTVMGDRQEDIFQAGADGFLIGNYLTTNGRDPAEDAAMIHRQGFHVLKP